jgi:hypothetical protein
VWQRTWLTVFLALTMFLVTLAGNEVHDLDPLANLFSLEILDLSINRVDDIAPLALTSLKDLRTMRNAIGDIGPLVANSEAGGLDWGDEVFLEGNPLDPTPGSAAVADYEVLLARGVDVPGSVPQSSLPGSTLPSTPAVAGISPAVAAQSRQIDSRTVHTVTVDLDCPFIELDVATANDVIGQNEDFRTMISRLGMEAAVNGNFFDAYDTLEPYNSIMRQGRMLYMEGTTTSLVFDSANNIQVEYFSTVIKGYLAGKRRNEWNNQTQSMDFYLFEVWYVNRLPSDPTGVYLYTRERGAQVALEGGTVVTVIGDQVHHVTYGANAAVIPWNGYLVYCGSRAVDRSWVEAAFKIGRSVELEYQTRVKYGAAQVNLNVASGMISAGPLLVKNGVVVANAAQEGFTEEKITTFRGQRSAAGVNATHQLILATVPNVTIIELAEIMRQLGAVHAMSLDGGASSGLYANGQMLTTPGRKLSTVLAVYDRSDEWAAQVRGTRASSMAEAVQMGKQWLAYTCCQFDDVRWDDWYAKPVSQLVALGILNGFGDATVRPLAPVQVDAFVKMIVTALGHRLYNGAPYWAQPYIDKAVELGLIMPGDFDRYDRPITRGKMARIIVRAAKEPVDAATLAQAQSRIKDYGNLSADIRDYVLQAYALGIVSGFEDGTFRAAETANRAAVAIMITRLVDPGLRLHLH